MSPLDQAPFIIADIGSNYCRHDSETKNLDLALHQIDAAAECGVSAVKFQLYSYQELYGLPGSTPYELPESWLPRLARRCEQNKVEFMCTAFSPNGIRKVDPFVRIHKIASSELGHIEMLSRALSYHKPLIISTGGADAREIEWLMDLLIDEGPHASFAVLECVASYPAQPQDYNLAVLHKWSLADYVGVSDHTLSPVVAMTAVGCGATIFEKHFDATPQGTVTPDSDTSIDAEAMKSYVRSIRAAHSAMGNGLKIATDSEVDMVRRHKRRLKVIKPIRAGERLRLDENFGIYRSLEVDMEAAKPYQWRLFDGRQALEDLKPGDPICKRVVDL